MLRVLFLCALVLLGVGLTMELSTPLRSAAAVVQPVSAGAVVQPVAETTEGISDFADTLAKVDRLEITAASSKTSAQPALVDQRISPSEGISIGSSKPPRVINRHRHDPKSKKVAIAAHPKSKPKATDIKRTTISERKRASDTEPCRLAAFGGLLKALNISGCAI